MKKRPARVYISLPLLRYSPGKERLTIVHKLQELFRLFTINRQPFWYLIFYSLKNGSAVTEERLRVESRAQAVCFFLTFFCELYCLEKGGFFLSFLHEQGKNCKNISTNVIVLNIDYSLIKAVPSANNIAQRILPHVCKSSQLKPWPTGQLSSRSSPKVRIVPKAQI